MKALAAALLLLSAVTASAAPLWIGVGVEGRRAWSRDGVHWSDAPRGDKTVVAVTYGAGRFVAVGRRIEITSDGPTWRDLGPAPERFDAIAFAHGQFVALSGTRLYSSETGERFTGGKGERLPDARCLAVAGGDTEAGFCFVAIGWQGESAWRGTTANGEDWDVAFVEDAPPATAICYGAGHFVIVGRDGLIETSHDGLAWVREESVADSLSSVQWKENHFEAAGERLWTSPDGVQWKANGTPIRSQPANLIAIAVGESP